MLSFCNVRFSGDASGESEELEDAGLLDSQELDWEVAGGGVEVGTTTSAPTTAGPEHENEIEWPGDSDDATKTREAQGTITWIKGVYS